MSNCPAKKKQFLRSKDSQKPIHRAEPNFGARLRQMSNVVRAWRRDYLAPKSIQNICPKPLRTAKILHTVGVQVGLQAKNSFGLNGHVGFQANVRRLLYCVLASLEGSLSSVFASRP